MADIVLKLNTKTARRLSYAIGRSHEANAVVSAATGAAKMAEQNVRDIVSLVADQTGDKLPSNFGIVFDEEESEIIITTNEQIAIQSDPQVNGVNHE